MYAVTDKRKLFARLISFENHLFFIRMNYIKAFLNEIDT